MEPVSVSRHNRKQVLKNLYGGLRNEKPKAPRFKIGDIVRINKQKLHFEKGYEQNWRRELFIVFEIVQRIPIVYRLKDLQGEEIKENKISHFKTQLPSPVCLNGEWEVGLSEIIYPHSWLNVNETNNYFLYKAGDGNISSTVKRTIDVGCYETMLDIISAVQLVLPKNPNRFTIIYNKATKRVKINAVQGSSLHLENLGELLGFKRNAIIIGQIGSGLTHYKGINFQKGYGIGGIFRRLFRAALPFLVKGDSPECVKSELELFNLPGTQTVIQDGQWKQFHPLSNVFDNAPVEFHISGSAEDYIDLSQTQLYVKAKIVKVDNTPITKDDTIGPVNLFLHSLFSQVDVSLNDRVVSNSSNTYPYRSYIETLLNHGYDSKTSQLTAELFYKDSDDGLKKRTEFLKKVPL
ncbi:uncharacterized protein TNCV_590951 [Trichonephila clavipes]|nr:uncharacterized protein TNCV_590951 [Trichonephila clavipes]